MHRITRFTLGMISGLMIITPSLSAQISEEQRQQDKKELLQGYHQKPGVDTPFALPSITVQDPEGNDVSLNELFSESDFTVLKIVRGDWSIRCTNALSELGRAQDDLAAQGARLIAISPERAKHATRQIAKAIGEENFSIELYIDSSTQLIRKLRIAERLREKVITQFEKSLQDRREYAFEEDHPNASGEWVTPLTATVIVDSAGTVVWMQSSWNTREQATPEDITAALEALAE
ncbi:MAG: redoxin domain-containing protein [Phycisphaerales bacterium JB043]